ncbi:hypothetical protein PRIPAC_74396 [Pristionchus pacificus]|uniref:EGF domain-containing protein n=1 Tax=Pristionchus pacificus TaxID=54126 RepID=A0A2A6C6Y8_PRIPA|nr:hypothetical protein PRIPAC_74396 [Pristionchus pacificus]|eukprot:PDM73972.1 EGF domain-containing protein [Pristionchus pacificus]
MSTNSHGRSDCAPRSWAGRYCREGRGGRPSSTMLALLIVFTSLSAAAVFAQLCDRTDCAGRGTCVGMKLAPLCVCDLGYSGMRCEKGSDLLGGNAANAICEPKDCSGNGLCSGTKAAPKCVCNLGFSGARCEIGMGLPENLCTNAIACSNNGFCLGTAKNFICLCNLGFSGPSCALFVGK